MVPDSKCKSSSTWPPFSRRKLLLWRVYLHISHIATRDLPSSPSGRCHGGRTWLLRFGAWCCWSDIDCGGSWSWFTLNLCDGLCRLSLCLDLGDGLGWLSFNLSLYLCDGLRRLRLLFDGRNCHGLFRSVLSYVNSLGYALTLSLGSTGAPNSPCALRWGLILRASGKSRSRCSSDKGGNVEYLHPGG